MPWEKRARGGRYYTRSTVTAGRILREYVGTGDAAEAIAALDALRRRRREEERLALKAEQERFQAADELLQSFCEVVEAAARAARLQRAVTIAEIR